MNSLFSNHTYRSDPIDNYSYHEYPVYPTGHIWDKDMSDDSCEIIIDSAYSAFISEIQALVSDFFNSASLGNSKPSDFPYHNYSLDIKLYARKKIHEFDEKLKKTIKQSPQEEEEELKQVLKGYFPLIILEYVVMYFDEQRAFPLLKQMELNDKVIEELQLKLGRFIPKEDLLKTTGIIQNFKFYNINLESSKSTDLKFDLPQSIDDDTINYSIPYQTNIMRFRNTCFTVLFEYLRNLEKEKINLREFLENCRSRFVQADINITFNHKRIESLIERVKVQNKEIRELEIELEKRRKKIEFNNATTRKWRRVIYN